MSVGKQLSQCMKIEKAYHSEIRCQSHVQYTHDLVMQVKLCSPLVLSVVRSFYFRKRVWVRSSAINSRNKISVIFRLF